MFIEILFKKGGVLIYAEHCIYIYIYIYIFFLSLISESETHILYRFFTHRVQYFKPLFLEMLMITAYR